MDHVDGPVMGDQQGGGGALLWAGVIKDQLRLKQQTKTRLFSLPQLKLNKGDGNILIFDEKLRTLMVRTHRYSDKPHFYFLKHSGFRVINILV